MPIMCRWIPLVVLLLAEAPLAHAQTVPKLRITAFGEYIAHRSPEKLDKALTTNTLSPVDQVEDVQFVSRTNQIDAKLCLRFGIRFEAPNLDPVHATPITIRVTHPPLTRTDGKSASVDTWQTAINGRAPGVAGYAFDHPWEAAAGTWTFTVLFGNTVLAEQQFEVTATSDHAAQCAQPIS